MDLCRVGSCWQLQVLSLWCTRVGLCCRPSCRSRCFLAFICAWDITILKLRALVLPLILRCFDLMVLGGQQGSD